MTELSEPVTQDPQRLVRSSDNQTAWNYLVLLNFAIKPENGITEKKMQGGYPLCV